MKPDFALSLSFDGIALLARTPKGWRPLDDVSVHAPDLKAEMARLRDTAEAAGAHDGQVKLILPTEQIKIMTLADSGARGAAMQQHLNRAMDGATPYAVHELVMDWAIVGDAIQVAAVARETLLEAEVFTAAHDFTPVCFVAYAPDDFDGEIFFGATRGWDGPIPERDEAPFQIATQAAHQTTAEDAATAEPEPEQPQDDPTDAEVPPQDAEADDASSATTFADTLDALPEDVPDGGPEDAPNGGPDDESASGPDDASTSAAPNEAQNDAADETASDATDAAQPDETDAVSVLSEKDASAQTHTHEDISTEDAPAKEDQHEGGSLEDAPTQSDLGATPTSDSSLAADAFVAIGVDPADPPDPLAKAAFEALDLPASTDHADPDDTEPTPDIASETVKDPSVAFTDDNVAPEDTPAPAPLTPSAAADDADDAPVPAFASRRKDGSLRPPVPPRRAEPTLSSRSGGLSAGRDPEDTPQADAPTSDPAPAFASRRARLEDDTGPRITGPRITGTRAFASPAVPAQPPTQPPAFKSKPRKTPLEEPAADTAEAAPAKRGMFGRSLKAPSAEASSGAARKTPPRSLAGNLTGDLAGDLTGERDTAPPTPEDDTPKTPPKRKRFGIRPGKSEPKRITTTAMAAADIRPPLDEDPDIPPMPGSDPEQDAASTEREKMTVFGARKPAKPRRQPRFMGLILTAALLVFLAGMAAWASVFLDEGLARFLPNSLRSSDVADSTLDLNPRGTDQQDQGVTLTSLEQAPQRTRPSAAAIPRQSDALSETDAQTSYVATGIWQRAPLQPGQPASVPLGEVYATSIDSAIVQPDAVALIDALDHGVDLALKPPVSPLGPEVRFDLDDRGLVVATKGGALTPERFLVFAGKPQAVAPLRPPEARLLTEAPELLALRAIMANARPQARPDRLSEIKERSDFSGMSRAELAAFRPRARTVTSKDLAEEDTTATAYAIRTSPRPIGRPRDFARIVANARARQQETVRTAAATAVPRALTPVAPSSATVARQATQPNVVNLRKISLFGIFGKEGDQRAMVRLSNGTFVKVEVGDKLNGGRVAAINGKAKELRYIRNGRTIVLKQP